jgi:outer membrane protein OmpA-like peptidoglycan-associated protein
MAATEGKPAFSAAPPAAASVSKEPLGPATKPPKAVAKTANAEGKTAAPAASTAGSGGKAKPESAAEPSETAAKTANAGGKAAPSTQGLRKAGEPPDLGPMESGLLSPRIGSLPEPEMPQPAPPPPALLKKSAGSEAHLPGPPAPAPMPAGLATSGYQPAPPPPALPPPAPPPPHIAALSGAKPPRPMPVDIAAGQISFAGNSATLTDADKPVLERIVARYHKEPAKIRIVGYAGGGTANLDADQLAAFHAALGRAQAVAAALTKAGIPSNKILVEAAPAGTDTGKGRAEVLFEH